MVLIMKIVAINKHSSKLKIWRVEMPNAPYSTRCVSFNIPRDQILIMHQKLIYE